MLVSQAKAKILDFYSETRPAGVSKKTGNAYDSFEVHEMVVKQEGGRVITLKVSDEASVKVASVSDGSEVLLSLSVSVNGNFTNVQVVDVKVAAK